MCITSSPASTPSAPSNLPPEGWLSRWLPNSTGRRSGSRPARRANMLPIASTRTVSPAASHSARNRSRPRRSTSVSVSRRTPPFGVAPISAMPIRLSHSRLPSMRWLVWAIMPDVLASERRILPAARLAARERSPGAVPRIEPGTSVGMNAKWVLAAGLLLAGCKLIDQTTFAPSPEEPSGQAGRAEGGPAHPADHHRLCRRRTRTTRRCCATRCGQRRRVRPVSSTTCSPCCPAGADAAAGQQRAAEVMRDIMAQGVPASRIHLGLRAAPAGSAQEVRVYVR